MFGELLRRLTQTEPVEIPDEDARLALCALLVRIARTDGDYSEAEIERIDRILVTRYDLSPVDAENLHADAETLETEAPDTVRFTRAIKDAVPYEERHGVIEALWAVVLADGDRGDEESSILRLAANLLGVSDRDSNIIRQRVAKNQE
jgi:uncharacterized tellurite resistance protein B-like protein